MKINYTPAQIKVLMDPAIPNTYAAATVGVGEATVRRYRAAHGVKATRHVTAKPNPTATEVSREELLEAEVKELRAANRKSRSMDVAQQRVLQAIEEALVDSPITRYVYEPKDSPHKDPTAHHRQAVLLSDWHGGEVVRSGEVGGLNEFDWEILEARVDRIAEALLSIKRVRPALTGLDVWFLGDMVSGNIHDELAQTNQFPVAKQSVKVGQLMASLVARLAPHYADLHCIGISGNHARTQKPHASKSVYDSWDWTAYQLSAAMTGQIDNVTWNIPEAGMVVRKIAGRNVLLFHGDGIKSSMPGVPWGGVMRRTNELRKQYAEIDIKLDYFALGHFHQCCVVPGIFMNGSVIGTNEYGVKNFGGGESPKQLLLTWDEKRGRLTDDSHLYVG